MAPLIQQLNHILGDFTFGRKYFKPVFVNLLEHLKMVLNALVIWSPLGIALPVNRCRHEYRCLFEVMPNALSHRNTHARVTKLKAYSPQQVCL
jgi:hypothetical protein